MIWKRKTVQPDGRIRFDDGLFGDHTSQEGMLLHVGKQVLVGFNPKSFDEPAMVCGWDDPAQRGRLIFECLPSVVETLHGSAEGRRNAIAEKRRVTKALQKLKLDNPEANITELREALGRNKRSDSVSNRRNSKVVELPSGKGFAIGKVAPEHTAISHLTDDRMRNFAEATQRLQAAKS